MEMNILVCDDEESVREVVSVILEMEGYNVDTAKDGYEALQMVLDQIGHYELLLTDHKMPRLDGLRLVTELRGFGFEGKIIVLSGSIDQPEINAYKALDVDGILFKPFDFVEFRKTVSGLLSMHAHHV